MNDNEVIEVVINEDIDRYEAEMWKGLSPRHIKGGFLVLATVASFYLLTNMVFLVPPFLAVFISLVMAVPVGIWNFIKVEEMDFKTFIARKWKYAFGKPYVYEASFFSEIKEHEKAKLKSEKKKGKSAAEGRKPKKEKKKKMKEKSEKTEEGMQESIAEEYLRQPEEQRILSYDEAAQESNMILREDFFYEDPEEEQITENAETEYRAEEKPEEENPPVEESELENPPVEVPAAEDTEPEEQDVKEPQDDASPARYAELFGVVARQKEKERKKKDEKENDEKELHEAKPAEHAQAECVSEEKAEKSICTAQISGKDHAPEERKSPGGEGGMYKFGFYEELIASLRQTIEKQEQTIEKQEELIKLQKSYILTLEGGASR